VESIAHDLFRVTEIIAFNVVEVRFESS